MKRLLLALVVAIPAWGNAQMWKLDHSLPEIAQIQHQVAEIKGFVLFGYPDGLINYGRPASREVYAAATYQLLGIAEKRLTAATPFAEYEKAAWRDEFWILKWLGEKLAPELAKLGNDYNARVEVIKQGLAKHGIIVEDPYARFSDVPKGHWADEAIHSLRRAGIIRGYPDNTFRF
jgi:hypothetical protein